MLPLLNTPKILKIKWFLLINFHRFPHKNRELLNKWVAALGRENWFPSTTFVLCGTHFLENDFVLGFLSVFLFENKVLKKGRRPKRFQHSRAFSKQRRTSRSKTKSITKTAVCYLWWRSQSFLFNFWRRRRRCRSSSR